MGLAGARNSAVTGLQAQSASIAISADNIANAATPGYKSTTGLFSTLVTGTNQSAGYSSGGVSIKSKTIVETQGLVQATGRATDLAISGNGFFSVQDEAGSILLTRAGSFDTDNSGQLVNGAGYKMLAWPLDDNGRLPGAIGNSNTTAAESVESLVTVNTNTASGAATPTSTVAIGANLNAGEEIFQGATVTIDLTSNDNAVLGQNDIIAPLGGMSIGDTFTVESNGSEASFVYGGFAQSYSLDNANILGAGTTTTTFITGGADGLANNDKFQINTNNSGTVTFTFTQNSPDTTAGEFNSIATLVEAVNNVNGLSARIQDNRVYLSSTDANDAITFTDVNDSGLSGKLGFSDVVAGDGTRFNTLAGLESIVNGLTAFGAKVNSPAASSTLEIFASDPLQSLTLTKTSNSATLDAVSSKNGTATEDEIIVPVPGSDTPTGTMQREVSTVSFTDGTTTGTFTYGGIGATDAVSAANSIFGATAADGEFVDGTGGLDDGDDFTIGDGANTLTLTYVAVAPDTAAGEFNSMETLAEAINADANFRGRIVDGAVYMSAADPDDAVILTATTGVTPAQLNAELGGDIPVALGDIVAAGADRFNTLDDLNTLIGGLAGFTTDLTAGANASLAFSTAAGTQLAVAGTSNTQLLAEFGLAAGDIGDQFFAETGLEDVVAADEEETTLSSSYDPSSEAKNVAGGNIPPHFSRNITLFDSLGTGHDFKIAFLKVAPQTWATEIYALDETEVTGVTAGQVSSGTIQFNGDGSLKDVSSALASPISVTWANGAVSSAVTIDWGTAGAPAGSGSAVIGLTDGLRQFDSSYNVEFVEQNGVASGLFTGVEVSADGTVNARFSNGTIKSIYRIPIITVANQNGLSQKSGNVFSITQDSGEVNLKQAGQGNAGVLIPSSLEGSTADITEELTRTIGIQSNYNANATLISTVKSMEDELNRRL
jgi:flagellar hook-basal body protein